MEVVEGEDVEEGGDLLVEVVEVAGGVGVVEEEGEAAGAGTEVEEDACAVEEDVELAEACDGGGRRGRGIAEGVEEGGEDFELLEEGAGVAALEREAGGGVGGEEGGG